MTAEAAVQSEPLVVTEKDKVIDDDFKSSIIHILQPFM